MQLIDRHASPRLPEAWETSDMKILKRVSWKHVFTCTGCKSELEAEPSDVRVGRFGCYDEFETKYYVKCAVCKEVHFLKDGKVPTDIQNGAKRDKD